MCNSTYILVHTHTLTHTVWTQPQKQMSNSYTLRLSCRQYGLQYFRGWLGESKIHGQAVRKGGLEPVAMTEPTIHRWTFFFTRKASAPVLRHFKGLNWAQPDYLRKSLVLKLIIDFNHIYGKTFRATPRLVFYLIIGDYSLEKFMY